jgi:hypothetical protein
MSYGTNRRSSSFVGERMRFYDAILGVAARIASGLGRISKTDADRMLS